MIFYSPSSLKIRKWFTIIELLTGLFIITLAILAVISMINAANGHINTIRQETIAINLARESMEGMYNRRNTNRLRHPAEKDKHRLCTNNNCDSWWFSSGGTYYILQSDWNSFLRTGAVSSIRDKTWFLLKDADFIGDKPGWSFYRAIIPLWLYQKDVNITWWLLITSCISQNSTYGKLQFSGSMVSTESCGDDTPKEFRFCSKVEYEWLWKGNVELCGAITNYKE